MRLVRTGILTAIALSMAATPVLAEQVNPAAKLSIAPAARVGVKPGKARLAGGVLIAVLAIAAITAGVVVVATDDSN